VERSLITIGETAKAKRKVKNMAKGTVKWFDDKKGYGFIKRDVGKDVFVHYSNIKGQGHKILREGQPVEFDIKQGDRGPRAVNVRPLDVSA